MCNDLADSVNTVEILVGSHHNDTLVGDSGFNVMFGGAGSDLIDGLGGDDTLDGGVGHDTLDGDVGNDLLSGRDGNDQLFGGPGVDWVDFSTAAAAVNVNLTAGTATGDGADTVLVENLVGSSWNDVLTGNGGVNVLNGGRATTHSTAEQATTNSTVRQATTCCMAGNDALSGGLGVDRASFVSSTAGVNGVHRQDRFQKRPTCHRKSDLSDLTAVSAAQALRPPAHDTLRNSRHNPGLLSLPPVSHRRPPKVTMRLDPESRNGAACIRTRSSSSRTPVVHRPIAG